MADVVAPADFPAIYRAADTSSLRGQRRYLNAMRFQLLALIAAAVFGVAQWETDGRDWAGVGAALAFAFALAAEMVLLRDQPSRAWYGGRAVAESAKTLAWKFMVGGHPFKVGEPTAAMERLLTERLGEITTSTPADWLVVTTNDPKQITAFMLEVRQWPLDRRRELYRAQRVADQQAWYGMKAEWNRKRAERWSYAITVMTLAGLTAGVLKAVGVVEIDLLGVAAAVAAAATSWVQMKQHHNLVSAYAMAQLELSAIAGQVSEPADEEAWADFVANAEDAISREHTMWRASRH